MNFFMVTMLAVVIVNIDGYQRAFAMGALVPLAAMVVAVALFATISAVSNDFEELFSARWIFGAAWLLAVACGGVGCLTQWLIQTMQRE